MEVGDENRDDSYSPKIMEGRMKRCKHNSSISFGALNALEQDMIKNCYRACQHNIAPENSEYENAYVILLRNCFVDFIKAS